LKDKVVSIDEAKHLVKDEDLVATGGLTIHRKPMAFIYEIIRSKFKKLQIMSFGGGPEIDLMVAAGCVEKVDAAYVGFEILGFAPNFRKAIEEKQIEYTEHTEYSMMVGLQATMLGLEFSPCKVPARIIRESDVHRRLDLKSIKSPYTGEELMAYPPIRPDVAIIHLQRSDNFGNAHMEGVTAIDDLLIKASKKVILTVEEIVPSSEIMKEPSKTKVSPSFVDAIVKVPYGAHPTSCYPFYAYDLWHLREIIEKTKSGDIKAYLNDYIFSIRTFDDYLSKIGESVLSRIKPKR